MCAQTASAVFRPLDVKNGNFCKTFFYIVTTHIDEICYVKHVLAPLCVFFFHPIWVLGGGGGGLLRGPGHNLLLQFSSLSTSKMEFSKTDFFYIVTIQNDQISYVKHVLAPLHVFFSAGTGGGPVGEDTGA